MTKDCITTGFVVDRITEDIKTAMVESGKVEYYKTAPFSAIDLFSLDPRFINPNETVEPVQSFCTMGNRMAIPTRGVIAIAAKPKQGKSTSVRALLLSLLSGQPFDTVRPLKPVRGVLVFDTEMDKCTLIERSRPLYEQLGHNASKFATFSLIDTPKSERMDTIVRYTEMLNPDIVVIDQAAMLVRDFNDSAQCNKLRDELTQFAATRSVWVVVHMNKSTEDSRMKGHLGTMLEEMCVEHYTVQHNKNGVFEVVPIFARRSMIDDNSAHFTFLVNDEQKIVSADDVVLQQQEQSRLGLYEYFQGIFGTDTELHNVELCKRIIAHEQLPADSESSRQWARRKVKEAADVAAIRKKEIQQKRSPYILSHGA